MENKISIKSVFAVGIVTVLVAVVFFFAGNVSARGAYFMNGSRNVDGRMMDGYGQRGGMMGEYNQQNDQRGGMMGNNQQNMMGNGQRGQGNMGNNQQGMRNNGRNNSDFQQSNKANIAQELADYLNVDVKTVDAMLKDGKTFNEILIANGITDVQERASIMQSFFAERHIGGMMGRNGQSNFSDCPLNDAIENNNVIPTTVPNISPNSTPSIIP